MANSCYLHVLSLKRQSRISAVFSNCSTSWTSSRAASSTDEPAKRCHHRDVISSPSSSNHTQRIQGLHMLHLKIRSHQGGLSQWESEETFGFPFSGFTSLCPTRYRPERIMSVLSFPCFPGRLRLPHPCSLISQPIPRCDTTRRHPNPATLK